MVLKGCMTVELIMKIDVALKKKISSYKQFRVLKWSPCSSEYIPLKKFHPGCLFHILLELRKKIFLRTKIKEEDIKILT